MRVCPFLSYLNLSPRTTWPNLNFILKYNVENNFYLQLGFVEKQKLSDLALSLHFSVMCLGTSKLWLMSPLLDRKLSSYLPPPFLKLQTSFLFLGLACPREFKVLGLYLVMDSWVQTISEYLLHTRWEKTLLPTFRLSCFLLAVIIPIKRMFF